jgi:hypothetical protein
VTRRVLVAVALLAACGDDRIEEETFAAVSGSRLALHKYRFLDGTEQPESSEFYDKREHTRCTPQTWIDGVVRCVPVADALVYLDGACTEPVGRELTVEDPTHFLAYDVVDGSLRPVQVHKAGGKTPPTSMFYEKFGEACLGPYVNPPETAFFHLAGEVAGWDLPVIRDTEVGEGRVALQIHESDDGMRVPFAVRDRELDVACTPVARSGGSAVCEPLDVVAASYFGDPSCSAPVVVVGLVVPPSPPPKIARVTEASGCARYHAVGGAVSTSLYRRDGDACVPAVGVPAGTVYEVGAPLALPELARSVEERDDRRLRRIVLEDGDLRFFDEQLFDTATAAECSRRRLTLDDDLRCLPTVLAPSIPLFTPTCVVVAPVAELPQQMCERPAFATAYNDAGTGLDIHAIGDPVAGALWHWVANQCLEYEPGPGAVVHAIGPPIDEAAFSSAVYFGER